MKVLVLIPDLKHKGGVTNYYRCLRLDKLKNISYFFVNTIATDQEQNPKLSKPLLVIKKLLFLTAIYLNFIKIALHFQVIHINPSLNFKSFFRDMVFIFISRLLRKKILIFFRGWEDDFEAAFTNKKLVKFLFKHSYAKADRYIVLCQVFKNKLMDMGINNNNNFHIETTIADSSFLDELDIDKKFNSFASEVNFLFISRILKQKGIYIAMDAISICKEEINDRLVTLYIAGDGEELENAKYYAEKKGYTNIIFKGYVKNELKKELLIKSHIMLFPTYYGEGLPNSILEGMLYGMPIISRYIGGISDVVEHEKNGFLSDSMDSRIFADFCIKLIRNKEEYGKISTTNIDKAKNLFVTEQVKSRLLQIYDSME